MARNTQQPKPQNPRYKSPSEQMELPEKPDFETITLILLPLCMAGMLGLGLPNLVDSSGMLGIMKVVLITFTAGLVLYSINKLAIERLVASAARRMRGAVIANLFLVLFAGLTILPMTYAGLVLPDVADRLLQEQGDDLAETIARSNATAATAKQVGPVLHANVADLEAKVVCEPISACVSGGTPGYGKTARALESALVRARAIAAEFDRGAAAHQSYQTDLGDLFVAYQDAIGSDGAIWDRWQQARAINAQISQVLGDAAQATPIALTEAYVTELRSGDGPPAVQRLLNGYATGLTKALPVENDTALTAKTFPNRPGVSDTLNWVPEFLPVFLLVVLTDLIFPLGVWLSHYYQLLWRVHTGRTIPDEFSTLKRGTSRRGDR